MKLFECFYQDKNEPWKFYERYSRNNISHIKQISLKQEFFISTNENSNYKHLLTNENLERKEGSSKDYEKTFGTINPGYRLIRDEYWDLENPRYNFNPKIWYLDIETTAHKPVDVENCYERIVLIQIFDAQLKTCFVLGLEDFENYDKFELNGKTYDFKVRYLKCKDERNILENYFKLVEKLDPLYVFAWNGEGFDFSYLYNRTIKNCLEPNFSKYGNGELKTTKFANGKNVYALEVNGTFYMDFIDVYKKYTYTPRDSYSLDNIAKIETGEGKVNHNCFSSFDGFRTGKDYIMPSERPIDDFEAKIYDAYKNNDFELAAKISHNMFIKYGIIDTYLLYLIDEKLKLSFTMLMLSSLMGVNGKDILGTTKPWSQLIQNYTYFENKIIPDFEDKNISVSIKGGLVPEPQKGRLKDVFSVDINSAYPLLSMSGFNMSPETYIPEHKIPEDLKILRDELFNDEDEYRRYTDYKLKKLNEFSNLLKKYNFSCGINGCFFTREFEGIIPKLVKKFYSSRKAEKKKMLEARQSYENSKDLKFKEIESISNVKQMAFKILINSLYGALGNQYFKLFNQEIARAITGNTRFYILVMANNINDYLQSIKHREQSYWAYSDTDSGYFTLEGINIYNNEDDKNSKANKIDNFIKTNIEPVIEKSNLEFANFLNAYDVTIIKAEREVISDYAVFCGKKNYFMSILDNEGVRYTEPYIKKQGIDVIKSSTPHFSKLHLAEALKIILYSNEQELKEWIFNVKSKFINSKISDISKTSSVTRINYDVNDKGIPINSRAAIIYNNFIEQNNLTNRFNKIQPGEKLKLIYLKKQNPTHQNIIAFNNEDFIQLFKNYIDYDTCWEKYFMSSLENMTNSLNYNLNNSKETLDNW